MADDILVKRNGEVLEVTLNRPAEGNGATDFMAIDLAKLLKDPGDVKLVMLRGAGNDFAGQQSEQTGAVFHHHRLAAEFGHFLADDARDGIRRSPGSEAHQHAQRAGRIGLGACATRADKRAGKRRQQHAEYLQPSRHRHLPVSSGRRRRRSPGMRRAEASAPGRTRSKIGRAHV